MSGPASFKLYRSVFALLAAAMLLPGNVAQADAITEAMRQLLEVSPEPL